MAIRTNSSTPIHTQSVGQQHAHRKPAQDGHSQANNKLQGWAEGSRARAPLQRVWLKV